MSRETQDTLPMADEHAVAWIETSLGTQVLYVLTLLAMILPALPMLRFAGMWSGPAGANIVPILVSVVPALLLMVALFMRAAYVFRQRRRLDAPAAPGRLDELRRLALLFMAIGCAATLLQVFLGPLVRALMPQRSGNGVEFFVVSLWLFPLVSLSSLGVMLFEASRLLAFEWWYTKNRKT
jgi:membrane protein DedA with SNARE-associated domain